MQSEKANIDVLVLEYLKKKGYAKAERAFKEDIGKEGEEALEKEEEGIKRVEELAFDISKESNISLTHTLLFFGTAQHMIPALYASNYEALSNWVVGSTLDIYKNELEELLFPIFVHSYLDLISKDFSNEAFAFLDRFSHLHLDSFEEDISRLATIRTAEHLKFSEFARIWRNNQYRVVLRFVFSFSFYFFTFYF